MSQLPSMVPICAAGLFVAVLCGITSIFIEDSTMILISRSNLFFIAQFNKKTKLKQIFPQAAILQFPITIAVKKLKLVQLCNNE